MDDLLCIIFILRISKCSWKLPSGATCDDNNLNACSADTLVQVYAENDACVANVINVVDRHHGQWRVILICTWSHLVTPGHYLIVFPSATLALEWALPV